MDKIIIKGANYSCHLGVNDEERKEKQIIILDINIFCETKKSGNSDDLNDTIDYYLINDRLKNFFGQRSFFLIERVAEEVARLILDNYPAETVKVTVKKPRALKNANYGCVSIIRRKPN